MGDGGSASLLIYNGGTVSASSGLIGNQLNGTGNVDLEGSNSLLSFSNNLIIGTAAGGQGVVTVGYGTTLQVVGALDATYGILINDGGLIDPSNGTIGVSGSSILNGGTTTYDTLTFVNGGTLTIATGVRGATEGLVANTITGSGVIQINSGADLVLKSATTGTAGPIFSGASVPTIAFASNTGTLTLTDLAGFGSTVINNYVAGDKIVVGTHYAAETYSNGVLTLFSDAAMTQALGSLTFGGTTPPSQSDVISGIVPCFASGTRIGTPSGEIAVENLRVGDRVALAQGGTRPIVWIGRRELSCARHAKPRAVWPIRIAADAFGDGLPQRDLYVSPDHAIFAQGVLIPAKDLVNGHSIVQVPVDGITYWHIELDSHDVVLAEGLPAESFLENDNRQDFEGGDTMTLHPIFKVSDAEPCARMVRQGPVLEAVRRSIAMRSSAKAA